MALGAWHATRRGGGRDRVRHPASGRWSLDRPLVDWTGAGDIWTIGDACEGTLILGGNGSGKTSGSGRLLARSFLGAGFGGLVLTAKASDLDDWRRLAREAGRSRDLIVFGPGQPHRFNLLDYVVKGS